jgi:hypothetical protein
MTLSRSHLFAITVLAFELFTRPAFGQVPTPTVSVSSENAYTGQLGIKALDGAIEGWPGVYTREWATVRQLAGAWIQLNWTSPVQVSRIALWDRPNQWDNVLAGTLTFSDGSAFAVGALPSDASSAFVASFVTKSITWVRFTITAAQGLNIGLSEFQVFGTSSGGGGGESSDVRVPFTRIVIDSNPPLTTLEKGLADIDGDGKLDAIIGFGNPPGSVSGQGLAWYEFPHSGNPNDVWLKHTILASGMMYEDVLPFDVNRDGAIDLIAGPDGSHAFDTMSVNPLYWFENPRGHGGNPATDPWPMHYIGPGVGENNLFLADIDGDGKIDILTNAAIYFQDSPTSWTTRVLSSTFRGVTLLDIGSGLGPVNFAIISQTIAGAPFVWRENPREHGGNSRTDPWITHFIGPSYGTNEPTATLAAADFNGDGRMDVATAESENCVTEPVLWWEAPVDRRTGTWQRHVIDPSYQCVHNLRIADLDGDGNPDITAFEMEQSEQHRQSIFYSDGHGNFATQILAYTGGHNQVVGDVMGDGDLDILNANHGKAGAAHPIELWLNERR